MDINTYVPDLKEYLPRVLKDVYEFKKLFDSENDEFDCVWRGVVDTLKNQFIEDLTIIGVNRWENILNIVPSGDLNSRRLKIKARLNEDGRYTYERLLQSLNSICGENQYTCSLDSQNYTLTVRIKLTSRDDFNSVDEMLRKVTPANLIIDLSLLYNQHRNFTSYTHSQLSAYTHDDLRNSTEFMQN